MLVGMLFLFLVFLRRLSRLSGRRGRGGLGFLGLRGKRGRAGKSQRGRSVPPDEKPGKCENPSQLRGYPHNRYTAHTEKRMPAE